MWGMQAIRDNIICDLAVSDSMHLFHQTDVALKHNIKDWIKPCIFLLAEGSEILSYNQTQQLGPEAAYMFARLRDSEHLSKSVGCNYCGYDYGRTRSSKPSCNNCGRAITVKKSLFSSLFDEIAHENKWDWIGEAC